MNQKPLKGAALERYRAAKARERYVLEKARSERAKRGWETRRNPDNLFDAMARHLTKFKDTGHKRYYNLFRTAKRMMYEAAPSEAEMLAHNAADVAGWDLQNAMKFAKLS
jgi:hypothetical protein